MPKALRLLALGAIVAAPLYGQVSVDVVTGATSSNWSFSTGNDFRHPLTGFAAGASFTFWTDRKFSFAPEVLLVRKGASLDYPYGVRIDYRVSYVEVPVLLRYMVRTSGALRPYIIAGPEFGFTAACTTRMNSLPTASFDRCTTGLAVISYDQPDPLDYGVIIGAGAAFRRFSASMRYDRGLTDIFSRYSGTGTTRNTTWLVLVAVRL